MNIQIKKGLVEVCVLATLYNNDSYGYKMISDMSEHIVISESTLYPVLKRLEAAQCLATYTKEHNGRLRKYYSITPDGKKKVLDFKDEWYEIMEVYNFIIKESRDTNDKK